MRVIRGMKGLKKGETDGVITVMLAMLLFPILSLLLMSLESARLKAEGAVMSAQLDTAVASVSGEYYDPLYEEYGIYGMYGIDAEELIRSYLEYSEEGTSGSSYGNGVFAPDTVTSVEISDTVNLLSGGGALVKEQMITEGAYGAAESLAEKLLDAAGLLDSESEAQEIAAAKITAEQELAGMDLEIAELMQLLDGAPVSSGGYTFDENGNLTGAKIFVKNIVLGGISKKTVYVDNDTVYNTALPYYYDWDNASEQLRAALSEADSVSGEMMATLTEMLLLVQSDLAKTNQAIPHLTTLSAYQETIKPAVLAFENVLSAGQSVLSSDLYEQYLGELSKMQKYVRITVGDGYDFSGMKARLEKNAAVLQQVYDKLLPLSEKKNQTVSLWKTGLKDVTELMKGYSLEGLVLDYSGITGKVMAADDSLWSAVKKFLANGVDSYLFPDADSLSDRTYLDEALPSQTICGEEEDLFTFPLLADDSADSTEYLEEYLESDELSGAIGWLREGTGAIGEKLLLISYISDHFEQYTDTGENGALAYEQEYLLFGSANDRTNLRKTAMSIFGLRAICNLVYSLSDPTLAAEALELTGPLAEVLPFAAVVVQYILLIGVGVENALLETVEILYGKTVPLLESAAVFQTGLSDLASIGKSAIHAKAEAYSGSETFGLGYREYLLLFLMASDSDNLVYRSMDLMQGKMRQTYDSAFTFSECYAGFGVTVKGCGRQVFSSVVTTDGVSFDGAREWTKKSAFSY